MGTVISLIVWIFAVLWLVDHDKTSFWWVLLVTLATSVVVTAVVQFGTPREAREYGLRGFDMLSSPAARMLLLPMMILNVCLIGLVAYAYWFR